MKPFTKHTGIVATLNRANVDTDAIIPKQFLKSIKRTGYGPNAFFDWRYTPDGEPDKDFELNQPRFEGRQGKGGRTHLVNPAMAAAAAVAGKFVDIRKWPNI